MAKKTLEDIDVKGKKVFVRADFNVPLDEKQNITNDKRIRATLPTIEYLLKQGAAVILASHLGRPKGKVVPEMSTKPVAARLSELLGKPVAFAADCVGAPATEAAAKLQPGEVLLLENLRFHPEEEKNDPGFAKQLADLADVVVDDAFGCAHRGHASNEGITKYKETVAGYLIGKELDFIGKALEAPERPFVAILGGAKVSDKIAVIDNMIDKVNTIIIGGGMANTFLAAQGLNVGKSLTEPDKYDLARKLAAKAHANNVKLVLPVDVEVADDFKAEANHKTVKVDRIEDGWQALDSGSETAKLYAEALKGAKTIVWNGPMGVFEFDAFAKGTEAVAYAVAEATEAGAVSIVGGGDSIAALKKTGLSDKISHISTGGGATLEYLEGKTLPGLAAIADK
ncbi:MAG: phosphoglycerate kinase [Schwartzia sp.]|nr:phosphoglycerate kinase [Schwartzia sp. (in: firmicutes)]